MCRMYVRMIINLLLGDIYLLSYKTVLMHFHVAAKVNNVSIIMTMHDTFSYFFFQSLICLSFVHL